MKRLLQIISILSLLCLPGVLAAQTIPDTLDNRRYYPLEVGNEWQYQSHDSGSAIPYYERRRITESVETDGRTYFRQLREFYDAGFQLTSERVDWLRYNELGAILSFSDPAEDPLENEDRLFWYHYDFGDTLFVGDVENRIGGTYDTTIVLSETYQIPVASAKVRFTSIPGVVECCFKDAVVAADLGLVYSEVFDGEIRNLSFARIRGVEYGARVINVSAEPETTLPRVTTLISLYPNPTTSRVVAEIDIATTGNFNIKIRDALGRSVGGISEVFSSVGRRSVSLDVSEFAPGLYQIVLVGPNGQDTASLIVLRN